MHSKLDTIFFKPSELRVNQVKQNNTRFVHYTSASAAMAIISNGEVWMRKTACMNDTSEFAHGMSYLLKSYNEVFKSRLNSILDNVKKELAAEVASRFNNWLPNFEHNTFIVCLSEHLDTEDIHGRLSMWRAYGGDQGVAIVLNNQPFTIDENDLHAYSSPVEYLDEVEFQKQFLEMVEQIENHISFIRDCPTETIINYLFNVFRFSVLCTKHKAFSEEKEWRIVYCPNFDRSDYIHEQIVDITGIPQPVCKVPLMKIGENGTPDLSIDNLVERIIIGPSSYPSPVWQAFVKLLGEHGVAEPEKRVIVSNIPLR